MKAKLVAAAQIRCSHHLHKVGITSHGQIVLFSHGKSWLNGARAFEAIGGKPAGCYGLLLKWRAVVVEKKEVLSVLPPSFREAAKRCIEVHQKRRASNTRTLSMQEQLAKKTVKAAKEALAACKYRKSQSRWVGGEHRVLVTITDTDASISGESEEVQSARNRRWFGTNSIFRLEVPLKWYYQIYRRGIAVIDGCLVLNITETIDDAHLVVIAGKQGRGFEINPHKAKAICDECGNWHLRWANKQW